MADELRIVLALKGPDGRRNQRVIAEKLVELGREGNVLAIKEIYDRMDGKAPQLLEHTGKDGGPINVAASVLLGKLTRIAGGGDAEPKSD